MDPKITSWSKNKVLLFYKEEGEKPEIAVLSTVPVPRFTHHLIPILHCHCQEVLSRAELTLVSCPGATEAKYTLLVIG